MNQPCIPAINPNWSWDIILFIYCWILFDKILLGIFTLIFMTDINLWFPVLYSLFYRMCSIKYMFHKIYWELFLSILFSARECIELVLIFLKTFTEFSCEIIWRFMVSSKTGSFKSMNLIFLIVIRAIQIIYFILDELRYVIFLEELVSFVCIVKFMCVELFCILL